MKKIAMLSCLLISYLSSMSQDLNKIDTILKNYSGDVPGASLLIIKDGKPLVDKSYGLAVMEKNERVKPITAFRLASVSKQFTATAVLMLVNEGKFNLNTTLTTFFPSFPEYGASITLKHLLNHTSGIPDYESFVADTAFNPQVRDAGVLQILEKTDRGLFAPGTKYQYSNSAYALLALIVEKYSKMSFSEFLESKIFKPLKMTNTVAFVNGVNKVNNRAMGYTQQQGKWLLKDQSSTSAVLGDGGIYATTEDLFKWDQALYTEKLLPKNLLNTMFMYTQLTNGTTVDYGFGWHLKKSEDNTPIVYHTGSTTSFRNIIYRIPGKKLTIILLTNRSKPEEENMVSIAERILKVL